MRGLDSPRRISSDNSEVSSDNSERSFSLHSSSSEPSSSLCPSGRYAGFTVCRSYCYYYGEHVTLFNCIRQQVSHFNKCLTSTCFSFQKVSHFNKCLTQ